MHVQDAMEELPEYLNDLFFFEDYKFWFKVE